jgi:glucose/arabinose dehydrogenase
MCPDTPRTGAVNRVMPDTTALAVVSAGYRNPMYLRCHPTDDVCLVSELGDDGGGGDGAREKIIWIRSGTQYGFPCCSTTGISTGNNVGGVVDCNQITHEEASFPLNDTPFGIDWERGVWPDPYRNGVFIALHGSFYSSPQWVGTRIVFATTDPRTHAPTGPWRDFVLGFGPAGSPLERATDVAFATDGRMFFADDTGGAIYWVAPQALRMPQ